MKAKYLVLMFLGFSVSSHAQILKEHHKKTADTTEKSIKRKVGVKTKSETDKTFKSAVVANKKPTSKDDKPQIKDIIGTWHYESLEGVPGFESLNECGQKSNITYSKNSYHTIFYDNDCNLLTETKGDYELKDSVITVKAEAKDEYASTKITTTQTIKEYSKDRLVIRDDMIGAVVILKKKTHKIPRLV